jgi:hypothetical protein
MMRASLCASLPAMVLLAGSLASQPVQATTVHYLDVFTNNGGYADGPAISLMLEVSQEGELARFELRNDSTVPCAVAAIYFEQGMLLSLEALIPGPGTSFSWPATPGRLPAGNTLTPKFDTWFSTGADAPSPYNGINPGESVVLLFEAAAGLSADDVGHSLAIGDARVGAHLIALPDGSSESAVSTPEPGTAALLLTGGLVLLRRRRSPEAE